MLFGKEGALDANTYTEEEFKKILKTLFAEKKRVKELQKQLGEKQLQKKFQTKLTDIHKLSIAEEYAALKTAFGAKEEECRDLRSKLERVRPALKKLVEDLKAARSEIASLKKKEEISCGGELKIRLEKALERASSLERERERLSYEKQRLEQDKERLEEEKARLLEDEGEALASREQLLGLEEELSAQKLRCSTIEQEKQKLVSSLEKAESALEEKERELERVKTHEQKEAHRFESERSRLVERLAEGLSQLQRQTEIIHGLREENGVLYRECEGKEDKLRNYERQLFEWKEERKNLLRATEENTALKQKLAKSEEEIGNERHAYSLQAQEWAQREKQIEELRRRLEEAHSRLQKSDSASIREEYEAKLLELEKRTQKILGEAAAERDQAKSDCAALAGELKHVLEEKEKLLEKSYEKMRALSSRQAEMVAELEEKKHQLSRLEKEFSSVQNTAQNAKLERAEYEAEIRKAQQHLVKKVKEAAILRDLAERQKGQIAELQAGLSSKENELERLQNSLNFQQMHEQKLQSMAKERTQAAESLVKEWQEKYLALQQDWQEKKNNLQELQKIRENYEQMVVTVSNLKNILGKSGEA